MGLFDHMSDERRRQLLGVLLLTLGLLIGVSLASHVYFSMSSRLGPEIWASSLGLQNRQIANGLFDLLGFCAWVVPILLVMWGWNRIVGAETFPLTLRSVFIAVQTERSKRTVERTLQTFRERLRQLIELEDV